MKKIIKLKILMIFFLLVILNKESTSQIVNFEIDNIKSYSHVTNKLIQEEQSRTNLIINFSNEKVAFLYDVFKRTNDLSIISFTRDVENSIYTIRTKEKITIVVNIPKRTILISFNNDLYYILNIYSHKIIN